MNGTLERVSYELGGRLLQFERRLGHTVEEVWAALTRPDRVSQWLARVDAHLAQTGERQLHFDNSGATVYVTVTQSTPPKVLEHTWDSQRVARLPAAAHKATGNGHCIQALSGSLVRWELTPQDGGASTTLLLSHVLDGTVDRPDIVLAAWHNHLDQLTEGLGRKFLGGAAPGWGWGSFGSLVQRYGKAVAKPGGVPPAALAPRGATQAASRLGPVTQGMTPTASQAGRPSGGAVQQLQAASQGPIRVLVQAGKQLRARLAKFAEGFDFPVQLQGSTQHFQVYYQTDLGSQGQQVADSVLASCESDYRAISHFFGGLELPKLPVNVILAELSPSGDGSGGAYHYSCEGVDIYADVMTKPHLNPERSLFAAAAELVEVFTQAQGRGWDCSASNGEALSRVLSTELYPEELDGYTTAAAWLDSPDRQDFINTTEPSDTNVIALGCSVLFLNFLRYQLGYGWPEIVAAGGSTLAETYMSLTGSSGGYEQFMERISVAFPPGTASGLTTDNPFPLSGPGTDGGPYSGGIQAGTWDDTGGRDQGWDDTGGRDQGWDDTGGQDEGDDGEDSGGPVASSEF